MDSALIPKGLKRCPFPQFALWIGAWSFIMLWAAIAAVIAWAYGLNTTNLNDYFGFGAWITADLAIIALGAGAFFTGFMRYVLGIDEFKNILNYAVIIGFICYSSALAILALDIGQPLRGWFIFWHANVHSMLTEVAFCISCYFTVLAIEYIPIILENRQLDKVPTLHAFSHNLHHIMAVFAATGAFLSFFHQGSLGGVAGVLFGRPFAFRVHASIWPTTFFLFIFSAIACGPCFTILITRLTEAITRKKLVARNVILKLATVSGWLLVGYLSVKMLDTLYWAAVTLPKMGVNFFDMYPQAPFNLWILIAELGICGAIPAAILITKKTRENEFLLILAAILNCTGICINRYVMTVQALALPVMPFDKFYNYVPNWIEWITSLAPFAFMAILLSLSYRYLPIFPQEKELNP